jgi:hypothetical protein
MKPLLIKISHGNTVFFFRVSIGIDGGRFTSKKGMSVRFRGGALPFPHPT